MCERVQPERPTDPSDEIAGLRELWEASLRLRLSIENGDVDLTLLSRGFRFELPEGTAELAEDNNYEDPEYATAAFTIINQTMLGALAIGTSTALDEHFGDRDHWSNPVRAAIYMIRNAFAHDPVHPWWDNRSAGSRRTYVVTGPDGTEVRLDGEALDGQRFDLGHLGGINGFFALTGAAQDLVG